ncbi:MAG TPA: SUMF1/EgtB/PvdO family nonheme iron enzyme [Geobacteraceae bacterium]
MNNGVLKAFCLLTIIFQLAVPLSVSAESTHGKKGARFPDAYTDPATGMKFVLVRGGCYRMGEMNGDAREDERPAHTVCVDSFYIGRYDVTQGQWDSIMEPGLESAVAIANLPVTGVSWEEVQDFITRLNAKSGRKYRLPTEAEWEYAARSGGKKELYGGGSKPDSFAWYEGNSDKTPHPVGLKSPNGLGLYDMSGNVWQWVSDWYDSAYYGVSPKKNPRGPASGSARVVRGGSWNDDEWFSRTTARGSKDPRYGNNETGFRLVVPVR